MNKYTITQQQNTPSLSLQPSTNVLQRKCACGQHTVTGGECEACHKKRLQRKATGHSTPETVPPIVHDVLRSSGQPLDARTRAFMEPRFGHDFSGVRVHTDAQAAESARVVNALAYTVGNHIAFDTNVHQPNNAKGHELIAHELTHVIQQSQGTVGSRPENNADLEAEANNVSSTIVRGVTQGISTVEQAQVSLQRQQRGSSQRTSSQPTHPNRRQQRIIDTARRSAAIRCQLAMFRIGGIVIPGPSIGDIDPATEWRMRARSLAQMMFERNNPNMEEIGNIVSSMVNFLTSGIQIMIAPINDTECGFRQAYVRGLRPPIILCPGFFNGSVEERTRTMIHEAAHLAGIGNAGLGESYCGGIFDCAGSCGGFDSADSWAHFVHCLSGQIPDQPEVIQVRVPAGRQRQTPRRGSGERQ